MAVNFTPDLTLALIDEAATLKFAAQLALAMQPNLNIYLHGNLGAGKSTMVRGLLHALGYLGKVKSPTYNLVESYSVANCQFYHFDLYRFNDEEEWEVVGFRDYFNAQSVCLVEWPEKAENCLPTPDLNVVFEIKDVGRSVNLSAHTHQGSAVLKAVTATTLL
jgi:tRNA threonylcarbamoyladenosine biosynthesis protein TsaE